MDEGIGNSQSFMEVDEKHPLDSFDDEEMMRSDNPTPSARETTNVMQIEKYVMERADINKKTPLPEGWTLFFHSSGMPVYLHKVTNVVTLSKPYQVEGMVRDHAVQISGVPCLFRTRMNEETKKYNKVDLQDNKCPVTAERMQELWEETITPEELREYCTKQFQIVKKMFNQYPKVEKNEKQREESKNSKFLQASGFDISYEELRKKFDPKDIVLTMDNGTILIDLTSVLLSSTGKKSTPKKPCLFSPMGMSATQLLNEIIQKLCAGTMNYVCVEATNGIYPYTSTARLTVKKSLLDEMAGQFRECLVVLSEIAAASGDSSANSADVPPDHKCFAIASGVGRKKNFAGQDAAKNGLSKLLPKLRFNDEWKCEGVDGAEQQGFEEASRELFKNLKMDNPKILGLCRQHNVRTPLSLFKLAARCSMRWAGRKFDFEKEMEGHIPKITLNFGDMTCEARAVGEFEAKNLACQSMFKQMHENLDSYGALLELYDNLEKKNERLLAKKQHDELVRVQDVENKAEPNYNVLEKLQEEMRKVNLEYPPKRNLYGFLPERTTETQTYMTMISPSQEVATQTVSHPPPMSHCPQNYLPRAQLSNQPIQRPPSPMDHQSQYYSLPPPPPSPFPTSNNWSRHGQSSSRHQHAESQSSQFHNHGVPKKRTRWDDSPASSSSYSSDRRLPR